MFNVGGKLLNGIKIIYVDSMYVACVKGKYGESEAFRINSGVGKGSMMSPLLFNIYMDPLMKEAKIGLWRRGVRFQEEGRDWRLSGM